MHPSTTTYRLATPGGEFNKLYAMMRKQGVPVSAGLLTFPTVVAERNGKIVGFISTLPSSDGAVWAGPLATEGVGVMTRLRLIEAYERVLQLAGVKVYLHPIPPGHMARVPAMTKLGFESLGVTSKGITIMKRSL